MVTLVVGASQCKFLCKGIAVRAIHTITYSEMHSSEYISPICFSG